jgi:hypothetical protein
MIRTTLASLFLLTLGIASIEGCAASSDAEDEEASDLRTGESFRLYAAPHARPRVGCDTFTSLTVAGSTLTLENKLEGGCEVFVAPNTRRYSVGLGKRNACGAIASTGASRAGEKIKVTDYRKSTCPGDHAPIEVVLGTGPSAVKLYGLDAIHSGTGTTAGANCNVSAVGCEVLVRCAPGLVPTRVGSCFGPCVRPSECAP